MFSQKNPKPTGVRRSDRHLQRHRNVILTPHIGGSTEEAQTAIGKEVAQKMIQYLQCGHTLGAVNLPALSLPRNDKVHRIANIHKNVPGASRWGVGGPKAPTRGVVLIVLVFFAGN